jgi:Uncharacterised nucleotidyltransferase
MDRTNPPNGIDQAYRLLALCARSEGYPIFYKQLASQVEMFTSWQEFPAKAEFYGMSSLFWHHIQQSGVSLPPEIQRTFQGLYLRHRVLCQAHTKVFMEINALFEDAGIRALLLKGLALAYQYYPDPALRPAGDIDLLFEEADFLPARVLLEKAGFRTISSVVTSEKIPKKLVLESPRGEGLHVHVELHHYNDARRKSILEDPLDNEFESLQEPPRTLMIDGCPVHVLAPLDSLRYLSMHLALHLLGSSPQRPLQLKWSADFISTVEREAQAIDWPYLQQFHPDILKRLEVFYSLTPMPEHIAKMIPIRQILPPAGLDQYLAGWPVQESSEWRHLGFWRLLWRTLSPPSAWWLCLYYGVGERSVFWYGQFVYRLQILGMILWRLIRKR